MTSDTIGGDKADGNVIKRNISVSAETGSAVSVGGGDAVVGTQIKDVAGNVIIQHHVSDKDAARNQRIRQHLLDQLQATWIQGVLENSIYEVARLELGLESRPDAVERPWVMSLERPNQPPQTLPPTSKILDTFKALGGAMLILGEPGSGKTITLLELARELRKVALADERQPVPLVFNLSSWAQERPPLLEWLVGEMSLLYRVGRKHASDWLTTMPFHLLLDGLDEVSVEHRDACVVAIDEFWEEYGPVNLVVCSRTAEYEQLTDKLHLMGAAVIQPLNSTQINPYLAAAAPHLPEIVAHDEALQELAQTPLTLNIIALAYRERPPDELATGTIQERRKHLFATYVDRMFERRSMTKETVKRQSISYLAWLAVRMLENTQSVYYIEKMQPVWLGQSKRYYLIACIPIFALFGGLIAWLVTGVNNELIGGPSGALRLTLLGMLSGGLIFGTRQIALTEALDWFWKEGLKAGLIIGLSKGLKWGLYVGLIGGLILGLSEGLIFGLNEGLSIGLKGGLTVGLIFVLVYGLIMGPIFGLIFGLRPKEVLLKTVPNQGIWLSGRNALRTGLIGGLGFGLILVLIYGLVAGLSFSLGISLIFCLAFGGEAFIKHFLLRWFLALYKHLPFKLVPFLDEMAERIILRKVGGGYIFIHRMLLEYFADLEGKE